MQKLPALFSAFFAWYAVAAQPSNACFLHYSTDQGLSNDHITAIAKDQLGFLWIGTVNGLNRFDGRVFKVFRHDPRDKNNLPDNDILDIKTAPDGQMWVATWGGLCRFDPVRLRAERIALHDHTDTLKQGMTGKVVFDPEGMAWTTSERGIHRFDAKTGKQIRFFQTEQPRLGWYGALTDTQGRLWLVKDAVRRFDPATQTLKTFRGADPSTLFLGAGAFGITRDFSGRILVGTWGRGIWEYDERADDFTPCPAPPTLSTMLLPDTLASGSPLLWVGGGSSGLGVYHLDSKRFTEFKPDLRDPFTHNNYIATAFFRDPNGEVWIGTEVGLEHYAPAALRFGRAMIPPEKDMNQFSLVSGVVRDNTDPAGQRYFVAVWGTGLFGWNRKNDTFTRLKPQGSKLTGGGIFDVLQDSRGYLWECLNHGIRRHDPRTGAWRDYGNIFGHPERNNVVLCGMEDRKGNLWFGTNKEGLFRYNAGADRLEQVFYRKELANENGSMNITDLSEDALGRLWIACNSGGLGCFDPATGVWKQFFYSGQGIPATCNAVRAGSNGRIYAAFYGAFLELDEEGNLLRHFTQQNKLKTNRLFFIVEDRQGKIWFNSEYLLHCFNPVNGTFNYYGKPDGLFSNAMTDAFCTTPDGEMFVGFQNAFNFFYPDRLRQNLQPPPVFITSVKVMNEERDISSLYRVAPSSFGLLPVDTPPRYGGFLDIYPGEDFFEIGFAALNFNQQERNRYAYMLEGFNRDWVFTEHPVATFTNLNGGTYVLRMKAANNDGVWNETGAVLFIRVNLPFYKTWWFGMLVTLAVAGAVAGFFRYRHKQRRRLEIFRENLARDLHDEMGSTLSSIHFFSEFASQKIGETKPEVTPVLQRISQSVDTLSESMHDIIWAMKTQNDRFEDLGARMTEFGFRLLEARKTSFKTCISPDLPGKHLRPEVRRNIYLIFKEAVNNAAKYSEATEVELHLVLKKDSLFMSISDNGKGFDIETAVRKENGNGLKNMRHRATGIGGTLEIHTAPAAGTRVDFRIKV